MKTDEEIAEEVSSDILKGWCLPGMSVGWQIKNGCLEGDLRRKIAKALAAFAEERAKEAYEEGQKDAMAEFKASTREQVFAEGQRLAFEKAARICKQREEDEQDKARDYKEQIRFQSLAAADCAGELCEEIRTLKEKIVNENR